MHTVTDARAIILARVTTLGTEAIPLTGALDRVLSEDIISPIPLPPYTNSAMDGFALLSNSTPRQLQIIENIKAGDQPQCTVSAGCCARIMTGGMLPAGADAVVRIEDTCLAADRIDTVMINIPVPRGMNIRHCGEEVGRGDLLLKKGVKLRPQEIGLLASVGLSQVPVGRRPRIVLLTTGSELLDPTQPLMPGKIWNSNRYVLYEQILQTGVVPIDLDSCPDEPETIRQKLRSVPDADIYITSGGVSVGDYDFVIRVFQTLGVELLFQKVAMKPGKPFVFGVRGKQLFFGLPGNPVSSMIVINQFVRPAILQAQGGSQVLPTVQAAIALDAYAKPLGLTCFVRVVASWSTDHYTVKLTSSDSSAMLTSMHQANALMILDECQGEVVPGDRVTIQLL